MVIAVTCQKQTRSGEFFYIIGQLINVMQRFLSSAEFLSVLAWMHPRMRDEAEQSFKMCIDLKMQQTYYWYFWRPGHDNHENTRT
jgi:hypothetical protein